MSNKTTKKNFKQFKKFCKKWIDYFGLTDWEIEISHKNAKGNREIENRDPVAWSWYDTASHRARITLNTDWKSEKPGNRNIELSALHEVLEIMLGELTVVGMNRYVTEKEEERARHALIVRFCNALVGDING